MDNPYTLEPSQHDKTSAIAAQESASKAINAVAGEARDLSRQTLESYAEAWADPENTTVQEAAAALKRIEAEAGKVYDGLLAKYERTAATKGAELRDAVYELAGAGKYGDADRQKAAEIAVQLASLAPEAAVHAYQMGVEHGNGPIAFAAAMDLYRRGAIRSGSGEGMDFWRPFDAVRAREPWRAEAIETIAEADKFIASARPARPQSAADAQERMAAARNIRASQEFQDKSRAVILRRQAAELDKRGR